MPKTAAKKSDKQGSHGRHVSIFLPVFCVLVASLTVQVATGQNTLDIESGPENKTATLSKNALPPTSKVKELELKFIHSKNLTLDMEHESMVEVNFTLLCSHPSIAYSITMTTDKLHVVAVKDFQMVNITCADAFSKSSVSPTPASEDLSNSGSRPGIHSGGKENSTLHDMQSVQKVQGTFNFTLQADLLGRTWLHVFGKRYADSSAVFPHFLINPWNESTSSTGPLITVSANSDNPSSTASKKDRDHSQAAPIRDASESSRNSVPHSAVPAAFTSQDGVPYGTAPEEGRLLNRETELEKHLVTVIRIRRPTDIAFRSVLYSFVIMTTIGMGCKTEMSVVKEVLRKPVAPAIGFFCQYLFMPVIAFMVAKTLVTGDPAVSLGIFTCGICPGGGPSNLFSYLLDGDVSLSVTMTAISSVAALAMIPVWLFTLGTLFEDDKISLSVPFGRIFMTLAVIIVPLFIGLAVKRWLPRVAKVILKLLKPFTLLAILFLLTFGVFANLYVFRLFSPTTVLAGCLLPYIGYVLGAVISLLLRQPCYRVKTIAIETGIQNTSIAYLLLIFSLPAPDGDMGAVGPMASAIMTPLPLFLLVLVYLLYKRLKKGKDGEKEEEEGKKEGEEEVALREGEGLDEKNGNVLKLDSSGKV